MKQISDNNKITSLKQERRKIQQIQYTARDWERQFNDYHREDDERSPSEIDRSRVIHCTAFRILQGKTQVFGVYNSDLFRTRLTHSLEVAQIAKGIAMIVGANTELVEAICLAHDIGHPPFGHAGERALNDCMHEYGFGFYDSNAQNLRILSALEYKSRAYPGLNLTRATLDGLLKHKMSQAFDDTEPFYYPSESELIQWVLQDGEQNIPSLESQIMDWADQVAYSVHDLEDGIHAHLITVARLSDPTVREDILKALSGEHDPQFINETFGDLLLRLKQIEEMSDARDRAIYRKSMTSELIHGFVTNVKTRARNGTERSRQTVKLLIGKEERGRAAVFSAIAHLLIIHDHRVVRLERRSRHIISRLFEELIREDALELYPNEFRSILRETRNKQEWARVTCDYIASLTDMHAETLFNRLYVPGNGSVFDMI